MRIRLLSSLFLSVLLCAAPSAHAGASVPPPSIRHLLAPQGGPILPSDFQGIWSYNLTVKDCETMTLFFSDSGNDTLCADDAVSPADTTGGGDVSCNGDVTSNGYHVTCTGSVAIDDTCTANYDYDFTGTLSGNTLTYVGLYTITYDHCGEFFPSTCFRYDYTATRIGNASTECATPVEPMTWGGIKSRFR